MARSKRITPVLPTDDWKALPALNGGLVLKNPATGVPVSFPGGTIRNAIIRVEDCLILEWNENEKDGFQRPAHGRIKDAFSPVRSGSITVMHYKHVGQDRWLVVDGGNRLRRADTDGEPHVFADIIDTPNLNAADFFMLSNDKTTQKLLSPQEEYRAAQHSALPNTDKDLAVIFNKAGCRVESQGTGSGVVWEALPRVRELVKGATPGHLESALRVYREWQEASKEMTPVMANPLNALLRIVDQVGEDGARKATKKFVISIARAGDPTMRGTPKMCQKMATNRLATANGDRPTASASGSSSKAAMPYAYAVLAEAYNTGIRKDAKIPTDIKQIKQVSR